MFQVDENYTRVSEFVIVGFPSLRPEYFAVVAWFFFFLYVTTVVGNLLLVVVFASVQSLQKPMYIIMVSLALSDIGKYGIVCVACHTCTALRILCPAVIKNITPNVAEV